jgi:hypothetical protein
MFLYHALFDLAGFAQLGFQGVELAVHVRNRFGDDARELDFIGFEAKVNILS